MGVTIHILDRRSVRLDIGGFLHEIGVLRYLSKLTELESKRAAELESATLLPSPAAALVATSVDLPSASSPSLTVSAHPVIGWEEGRGSVTDLDWDYLPVLGYATKDTARDVFVLHELNDGKLHRIGARRSEELGILVNGVMARHGQPLISRCFGVKPFIPGFAETDCLLENGRREKLIIQINGDALPDPSWLVGRKPRDAQRYDPGPGICSKA